MTFSVTGTGNSHALPPLGDAPAVNTPVNNEWMVETQWMDVDYERVPKLITSWHPDIHLSGVEATSQDYILSTGTTLLCKITWKYKKEKVVYPFLSGHTQAQTFKVYPEEKDYNGVSYGALPTNAWGPKGKIKTEDTWYYRRAWNTSDVEKLETGESFSFQIDVGKQFPSHDEVISNASDCFSDFRKGGDMNQPDHLPPPGYRVVLSEMNCWIRPKSVYDIGDSTTGYSASLETDGLTKVKNILTRFGDKTGASGGYFDKHGAVLNTPTKYRSWRHSY
jgi:hypothetical protein